MTRPSRREIESEIDEVAGDTTDELQAALAEAAGTRMLADGSIIFVDADGDPVDLPGEGLLADFTRGDV